MGQIESAEDGACKSYGASPSRRQPPSLTLFGSDRGGLEATLHLAVFSLHSNQARRRMGFRTYNAMVRLPSLGQTQTICIRLQRQRFR
jgi:hypothetical protein